MKTILISILFLVLNCKGQEPKKGLEKNGITILKTATMYYIPTINSNFEKFEFQKTKEKYIKTDLISSENDKVYNGTSYKLEEKIDNRHVIKYYGLLENGKIINPYELTYFDNSPFEIRKTFYPNGNIKEKGLYILQGNVYKGIWYYFDENGKPTHSIDNDKAYNFRWEDIEKFMIENKIPILLGYKNKFGSTEVNRASPLLFPESSVKDAALTVEKPMWSIIWKGETFNQYYMIVLDGNTGKILYRKKYWVSEEGENVPEPIIENFTK
ncbi:hypothetical protein A0O34_15940 [Chryseobacterium glaciei]|uniref:MORN repeat variant n=1 Tax=Chryseobacterium glaciei TaxID=1685010 RepID=A0A172XYE3_9FLAO|nr:hypothetical protein [Chryseobacterium glaciei]ANF51910.1 hypothetical protein A0O34_15940 [Chryseobacterium glaciei]